jgi:deoxyadenosine kinase
MNAQSSYTRPDETLFLENLHIGISGLIGAGKSTLSSALGKVLDLPVYFEPTIDNSYLADFYADPKKFSFHLQIYLLNNRFRQQQQIIWSGKGGIQDRTIYEDGVFAKMLRDSGLMDERDYHTYLDLFANMSNFMKKPNVIIHLDVTPEESMERIKRRARECEKTITIEYLRNLYNAYDVFIADISRVIPVIKVNWSEFRDAEEIAEVIKREYLSMQNIREMHWKEGYKNVVRKDTPQPSQRESAPEATTQEEQRASSS